MSFNCDEIISKVRDAADVAADITQQAIKNTKRAVDKTIEISTLNTKINRIKVSISKEFIDIGKLVYSTHKNPETPADGLEDKLELLDELHGELEEVTAERDRRRAE